MNRNLRWILLTAILCGLFLGGLAKDSLAVAPVQTTSGVITIQSVSASGGGFHLSTGTWQIASSASGAGYHLDVFSLPSGTGTPCCCSYLTCMQKH